MKKILLSLLIASGCTSLFAQNCSDLFFSVYYAGGNNDKALEIYNPTHDSINLANYTLDWYDNGATAPTNTTPFHMHGYIKAFGSYLVANGQLDSQFVSTPAPGYYSLPINDSLKHTADQLADTTYPGVFYFNGNDPVTLSKNGTIIDIFGKIGQDPGYCWGADSTTNPPYTIATRTSAGAKLTYHMALVRKHSIEHGVTVNPVNYFNALAEYDSVYYKSFAYSTMFHNHTCDCKTTGINDVTENTSNVSVYPNPVDNHFFNVLANEQISDIHLYDLVGRELQHVAVNAASNKVIVEVGKLTPGTYITTTKLQSGKTVATKLVIQ